MSNTLEQNTYLGEPRRAGGGPRGEPGPEEGHGDTTRVRWSTHQGERQKERAVQNEQEKTSFKYLGLQEKEQFYMSLNSMNRNKHSKTLS